MDLFVGGTKKSKESNPKGEPTPKAKPKALSKRSLHMPKQVKIMKNEKTNKEEGSLYDSLKSTRTISSPNAQSSVEAGPLSENQFPPVEVLTKESLKQTLEHVSLNPACDPLSYEQTKKNTALAYVQLYKNDGAKK
uniref:Uncharacterized protein n=1 Tax=Acrobeloides nanus TaxID=290746 RepID=A0A914C9H4_9BILA